MAAQVSAWAVERWGTACIVALHYVRGIFWELSSPCGHTMYALHVLGCKIVTRTLPQDRERVSLAPVTSSSASSF